MYWFVYQVLQNNAKYQVVPKKLTIGKRLAQCLHPALPGGVHRKALETYEIIFKIIGPKRLAKDLFLYRYFSLRNSVPNVSLKFSCFSAFYVNSIVLLCGKNQAISSSQVADVCVILFFWILYIRRHTGRLNFPGNKLYFAKKPGIYFFFTEVNKAVQIYSAIEVLKLISMYLLFFPITWV